MWQLQLIAGCALALTLVYLFYCNLGVSLRSRVSSNIGHEPNPEVNDEAGTFTMGCGQIRAGEWQCNCAEPHKGCLVLIGLKSANGPAEEMTNRRGAIAAQKARKRRSGR